MSGRFIPGWFQLARAARARWESQSFSWHARMGHLDRLGFHGGIISKSLHLEDARAESSEWHLKGLKWFEYNVQLHAPATACHNWTYVPTRWSREQKPRVAYDIFLFYSCFVRLRRFVHCCAAKTSVWAAINWPTFIGNLQGKNSWLCTYALGRKFKASSRTAVTFYSLCVRLNDPRDWKAKKTLCSAVQFVFARLYGGQWLVLLLFWPNGSFMHLRRR